MKYRGSWNAAKREEVNDETARWKITYVADTRLDSLDDVYAWWWKRDGRKQVEQARDRASNGRSADVETPGDERAVHDAGGVQAAL